jgi:hypothetical protein
MKSLSHECTELCSLALLLSFFFSHTHKNGPFFIVQVVMTMHQGIRKAGQKKDAKAAAEKAKAN